MIGCSTVSCLAPARPRGARASSVALLLALAACGSNGTTAAVVPAEPPAPARPPAPRPGSDQPPPKPPAPKPTPAPATGPFPIVLMHGMAGFNELEGLPITISYFNGIQADLAAHGEKEVFVTLAPPFDTSENRAAALKPQIEAILKMTGAAKVNLIGHSQGGLDARVLASPEGLNMGDVIASVTTIATPHGGTPVADAALGLVSGLSGSTLGSVTDAFLQLLEDGVYPIKSKPDLFAQANEMTTSYMKSTFNPKFKDAPGVAYASYAGRTNLESGSGDCDDAQYPNDPQALDVAQGVLTATATYIQSQGLENDGLVPISSAKWGTFVECVPADHLKEVGMIDQNGPDPVSGFDHLLFFRVVVARLRAQGY